MRENDRTCIVHWLGQMAYLPAWQLQDQLALEIAAGKRPPTLLLLEHPHTYTIGRRGQAGNLLWDQARLEARSIKVYDVDRGGDITYHGPGQLVGYPLLPLAPGDWGQQRIPQADFVGYVRRLETALINALAGFGLKAMVRAGLTGVWVEGPPAGKIASIGVKVDSHGISRHGFALNIAPDRSYWEGIVPCGLAGVAMVALEDYLQPVPDTASIAPAVAGAIGQVFDYTLKFEPFTIE